MTSEHWLDWEWLQENRSNSWPRLVCQHIVDRARNQPTDSVLEVGDEFLQAGELARRVAGVAHRLAAESTQRPVVLLIDRSITSVVGLFAVWWAGRCLIPLSVDEPIDRLVDIVDRVGDCTVADTTGRGAVHLAGRNVVDLTVASTSWMEPVSVPADDPALVIFTSGSTGRPKGVVRSGWMEDASLVRYNSEFVMDGRSVIFGPLHWLAALSTVRSSMQRGCALLVDPLSMSSDELVADLDRKRATRLFLTPSFAETLANSLQSDGCITTLEAVQLNGEASSWSTIAAARRLGSGRVSVCARYGASEVVGTIMSLTIEPDAPLGTGRVPLGRPGGDHVELRPVEGDSAELREMIVHRWVATYLDDPELVEDRFEIDDDGDRCWRSGDLFEIDPTGNVFSAGRVDDVVKISGKLVSPAEATAALNACPGVRRALVLVRTLESGKKQLVGHVEAAESVDPDAIRRHLVESLPAHLRPAVLTRHDFLPMTARGKVDREALSVQDPVQWRVIPPKMPTSTLEIAVVNAASGLLGITDLGVDDDLWAFGLDSLGAIELSAHLADVFDSELTINDFLGASTPGDIARLLAHGRLGSRSHVVTLVESDDAPSVFVMAGAGSPAFRLREVARGVANGAGVVAFEQFGLMQPRQRRDRTVVAAATRNLRDVRKMSPSGPLLLIGHSWGGLVAHEMACRLREEDRDVVLVLLDTSYPGSGIGQEAQHAESGWWRRSPLRRVLRSAYRSLRRMMWRLTARKRADHRFWLFFEHGVRSGSRHRPGVFDGPMLVVQVEGSPVGEGWNGQPHLHVVETGGDHNSMVLVPHVTQVVDTINAFVSGCRADRLETRSQSTEI